GEVGSRSDPGEGSLSASEALSVAFAERTPHPSRTSSAPPSPTRGEGRFLCFGAAQGFRDCHNRQLALRRRLQRMAEQLRRAALGAWLGRDVVAVENQPAAGLYRLVEGAIDVVCVDMLVHQRR